MVVDIIALYPGSELQSSGLNYNFDNLKSAVDNMGGGVQTYTIAASGALLWNKADFKCDGVADDVEINAAIGSISPTYGGALRFTEGQFNISNPIVINKDGILFEGISPVNDSSATTKFIFADLNASGMCITTNGGTMSDFTMRNIYATALATGSAFFGSFNIDCFKLKDCSITTSGIPIFGTSQLGISLCNNSMIERNYFNTAYISGLNKEYGFFNSSDYITIKENEFDIRIGGSLLMPSGLRFDGGWDVWILNNNLFVGNNPPYNILDLTDVNLNFFWVDKNHIYGAPGYRADTNATKAVEWGGGNGIFTGNIIQSECSGTSLYLNPNSDYSIALGNISKNYARAVPLCVSGTGNVVANNVVQT